MRCRHRTRHSAHDCVASSLAQVEDVFAAVLLEGNRFIAGVPAKRPEVPNRIRVRGAHTQHLAPLHVTNGLLGPKYRQRAIQSTCVDIEIMWRTYGCLPSLFKAAPREQLFPRERLHIPGNAATTTVAILFGRVASAVLPDGCSSHLARVVVQRHARILLRVVRVAQQPPLA